MQNQSYREEKYLTSQETKKELKMQDCDLAHIRVSGKLKFVKKGNAFMYSRTSIENFKKAQQASQ
ncbi:hypothetical protein [uncultured Arcticibacterium sp.]|uniref:hypothetical protein n=1 Tax=uncultured Arcticibacterium sp. TaxID=2173042 RepID=UPI0030F6BA3C